MSRPYSVLPNSVRPSSPESQPVASSVFMGSGRSQSKHWNVRSPLPPEGSARIKSAPQLGQVGRLPWPMARILPPVQPSVKQNQAQDLGFLPVEYQEPSATSGG